MNETEFTEAEYARLLDAAAARYRFVPFDQPDAEPPVALWRHDVDFSPQRALALARLEAERNVRATYFVGLHSDFYNLLEEGPAACVREILELGHFLGLHFDRAFVETLPGDADEWLPREREWLETVFAADVRAYSTHNPGLTAPDECDEAAGMVNAYGARLQREFVYCSDSNGFWRHEHLRSVLESGAPRVHVLTHPGWWVPEPLPPRARIERAATGRAAAQLERYDRILEASNRPNIR